MANTFRRTGTIYVSKAGNDANPGTDPEAPKASLNAALGAITANNQSVVVGTGMYEEVMNRSTTFTGVTVVSDGYVKFRAPNGSGNFTLAGTGGYIITNIVFEAYGTVSIAGSQAGQFTGCEFYNCGVNAGLATQNGTFQRCKFIDCSVASTSVSGNGIRLDYCIVLNGNHTLHGATNSYFNSGSTMRMKAGSAASNFAYNNVMGTLFVGTTSYADLASQQAAQPTFNANSFNASPRFNNASKYDFTLLGDSPHLGAAADGVNNIGGTNFAKSTDGALDNEWKVGVAGGAVVSESFGTPDLILSGSDWILNNGKNEGWIRSGPIMVSANPVQLGVVSFNGLRMFNKAAYLTPGSTNNSNVPDTMEYQGNDAGGGGNHDRLTYRMRWADSDTSPGTDPLNYKNGSTGLIPTGEWRTFEWNTTPTFDNTGKGNGEVGFNSAQVFIPNVTYVQIEVTLRNYIKP